MLLCFSPALEELLKENPIPFETLSSHNSISLAPLRLSHGAGVFILGDTREPDIGAYAAALGVNDLNCARMSWELSYNRLGYANENNFSDICGAIIYALEDAKNLVDLLNGYVPLNWVICINFLIQLGDYEAMPEDIKKLTAKTVIKNDGGKWWFNYELSFTQDRACNQLPELNMSAGVWGKSLGPLRAVLFVRS